MGSHTIHVSPSYEGERGGIVGSKKSQNSNELTNVWLLGGLCSWCIIFGNHGLDKFPGTSWRKPGYLHVIGGCKRVLDVNVPQSGPRNPSRLRVNHLSPVTGRILRMPELEPRSCFCDGILPGLLVVTENWKPQVEKLLKRVFMCLEEASGNSREIGLHVDLLELENHFCDGDRVEIWEGQTAVYITR